METRLIFQKIPLIMSEIGAIAKSQKNTTQNYFFRGIDAVMQAVQPLMAKHGVFSVPKVLETTTEERTSKSGGTLIFRILKVRSRFYATDGSFFDAVTIGEACDSGDKASNKAMSAAEKYALLEVFKIPTEEPKDSENDSHEVEPKQEDEGYDPQNRTHQDWLMKQLKDRKVDDAIWDSVGMELKGKPPTALTAAITAAKARMKK